MFVEEFENSARRIFIIVTNKNKDYFGASTGTPSVSNQPNPLAFYCRLKFIGIINHPSLPEAAL